MSSNINPSQAPQTNPVPLSQEVGEFELSFTSAMAAAFYTDTFEETNKAQRNNQANIQRQRVLKLREELAKIILPDAYVPKQVTAAPRQQFAVIVLLAQVMIAQARTNSEQWKTYWRQATEDMNTQIRFAPIVKKATIAAAQAQANATKAEATKQMQTAITSGLFAGLSIVGGAMDSFKAYKQERTSLAVSKDLPVQKLDVAEKKLNDLNSEYGKHAAREQRLQQKLNSGQPLNAKQQQKLAESRTRMQQINDTEVPKAQIEYAHARTAKLKEEAKAAFENAGKNEHNADYVRAKAAADNAEGYSRNLHSLPDGTLSNKASFGTIVKRGFEGFKDGSNAINEGVGKAAQKSHFWGMMSQVSAASIASVTDTQKAFYEAQAGTLRAEGQMGESYAQYYGQNYQRTSELLQNTMQTFDSTLNMLQQATNRHGETIQRLFG